MDWWGARGGGAEEGTRGSVVEEVKLRWKKGTPEVPRMAWACSLRRHAVQVFHCMACHGELGFLKRTRIDVWSNGCVARRIGRCRMVRRAIASSPRTRDQDRPERRISVDAF
jgi:hypothetical protein